MKLLVVVIRGLQAGATGPYGSRWIETFSLDMLASQGVVFDSHLSVHPDPAVARRVWRTGCHHFPLPPGLADPNRSCPDLLAVLAERGTPTHLVVDASRPFPEEFTVGWSRVDRAADTEAAIQLAHAAIDRLTTSGDGLVWLELSALLPPWRVPPEIVEPYFAPVRARDEEEEDEVEDEDGEVEEEEDAAQAVGVEVVDDERLEPLFDPTPGPIDPADDRLYLRIQQTYAAAVTDIDALLGAVLDGLADDIHLIVTSDAGQALGEHAVVGPVVPCLHQEIVHVPLIVYGPGCRAGRHVSAQTASVDLAPTIAELAGVAVVGTQGKSLVPLLGGEDRKLRDYVCMGWQVGDVIEWGLRTPELAFLLPMTGPTAGRPRIHVKPDDRWEVNDLSQHLLESSENLPSTLRAFVEACGRPGPLYVPLLREPETQS